MDNTVKTEAQWQAEDDARTLARAEEIKGNRIRYNKATSAGRQLAQELLKNATEMASIGSETTKDDALEQARIKRFSANKTRG